MNCVFVIGKAFADACPDGCDLSAYPALVAMENHAKLENRIGLSMLGVGGAAVLTGVVLQIANRPRRVARFEVTPTTTGINATATWQF